MWYFAPHACGISISIACAGSRPVATSSSNTLSSDAESDCPSLISGSTFFKSSPNSGDSRHGSRIRNALRLPRSVLISPLCARCRNGCASAHVGTVLVEYRWWTSANGDTNAGSFKSL